MFLLRLGLDKEVGELVVQLQLGQEEVKRVVAVETLGVEDIDELIALLSLVVNLLAYLAVQPDLCRLALLTLQDGQTELTVDVAVVEIVLYEGQAHTVDLEGEVANRGTDELLEVGIERDTASVKEHVLAGNLQAAVGTRDALRHCHGDLAHVEALPAVKAMLHIDVFAYALTLVVLFGELEAGHAGAVAIDGMVVGHFLAGEGEAGEVVGLEGIHRDLVDLEVVPAGDDALHLQVGQFLGHLVAGDVVLLQAGNLHVDINAHHLELIVLPGDEATVGGLQEVGRRIERAHELRTGLLHRELVQQCQGARLGNDVVGRDAETRRTEDEQVAGQALALRHSELAEEVHCGPRGGKLHGGNLDIDGRGVELAHLLLGETDGHVDVGRTAGEQVVDTLRTLHEGIVVGQSVDLVGDGLLGCAFQFLGVGNAGLDQHVLESEVGEDVLHGLIVGHGGSGIGGGQTADGHIVGIDAQGVELHVHHGGAYGQFPLHAATSVEALLAIAALHLVDGELVFAECHFLALEVLAFLGGQLEVLEDDGGRTGKVVGRDVLGHREVHHIDGVVLKVDGVSLSQVGTIGAYTKYDVVLQVHLALNLLPGDVIFDLFGRGRVDGFAGQRLLHVGFVVAVEHLDDVLHLEVVGVLANATQVPGGVPREHDVGLLIEASHLFVREIGRSDGRVAEAVERVSAAFFLNVAFCNTEEAVLVVLRAVHELEDAQGALALVGDRHVVHGSGSRLLGGHLCHVGLAHLELGLQRHLVQRKHGRGQVATLIDYRVLVHGRVGLLAGGGEQLHDAHGVGIGGCSRIAGHHRLCPRELREACLHLGHREVTVAHADYGREEGGSRCLVAHDEIVSAANRVAARHGFGILGVMPLVGLEMDFVVSLGEQAERAVHVSFHEGLGNLHGRGGDMVEEVLHVGSGQRIAASSRNGEGLVGLVLRGRGDAESVIGHDVL